MKTCSYSLIGIAVATLLTFSSLPAHAATVCTLDQLTKFMAQCFDPNIELSPYQKMGQAEIVEGRFCNDSVLIVDGYLICLGHDLSAVRLGAECWRNEHMKAAKAIIADDDPRKPEK
ncbi:MAG: hypothetical protein ABIW48_04890, partial [Burkholderiales bacterium]